MRCSDVVLWVAISMSRVLMSLVVDLRCSDIGCRAEYPLGEFRIDISDILRIYTTILTG